MINPFESTQQFRLAFNQGLATLHDEKALGTFILACANATVDKALFDGMQAALYEQFQALFSSYKQAFMDGHEIPVVDEDLLVFLKLNAIGIESIRANESRLEGLWKVSFNHLRSFRPRRNAQYIHEGISEPFDNDRFNFNRSYMDKECFWKGELLGQEVDLFYNKYPFVNLHGLLVVDRKARLPQLLTEQMNQYVFDLTCDLTDGMPGVGFGYNSYGAYASVNHLHFQMFVDETGLPVENTIWLHNGGSRAYPSDCHVFKSSDTAWSFIQSLHEINQPYNLLYVSHKVYVFPRKAQSMVAEPEWCSGLTWYELSGAMISFNYTNYTNLSAEIIESELNKIRLDK